MEILTNVEIGKYSKQTITYKCICRLIVTILNDNSIIIYIYDKESEI